MVKGMDYGSSKTRKDPELAFELNPRATKGFGMKEKREDFPDCE